MIPQVNRDDKKILKKYHMLCIGYGRYDLFGGKMD